MEPVVTGLTTGIANAATSMMKAWRYPVLACDKLAVIGVGIKVGRNTGEAPPFCKTKPGRGALAYSPARSVWRRAVV